MKRVMTTLTLLLSLTIILEACGGGGGSSGGAATKWTGTKQLGAAGATIYSGSIAVDPNGNVYVTGQTDRGLDGNTLMGTNDFFLTMYSSLGSKVRTKQLGVVGALTSGYGVGVDSIGNVYVTGLTNGGLDGNTLTGTVDFFLTKSDPSGNRVYTKQTGTTGAGTSARSVAVDSSGNVYVAGDTYGGLDGNTLTGTNDFFLSKYDSSGSKVYTKQLGATGAETYATGVAVDTNGNVYVTGWTGGDLDGNTLTGARDLFLTMYDSSGNKVRTKQLGVAGSVAVANGLAVDSSGNVYVTGWTDGGLDGNTHMGLGTDFFLTMYDSLGNKVRTKQLGAAGAGTDASGVAADSRGNVYVVGTTGGGLDGNTLTGISDLFLTKYDSSGNKVQTKQLGVAGKATIGADVTVDSSGNVFVSGWTTGGLDGNTLKGVQDIFITKYDPAGNKQ